MGVFIQHLNPLGALNDLKRKRKEICSPESLPCPVMPGSHNFILEIKFCPFWINIAWCLKCYYGVN